MSPSIDEIEEFTHQILVVVAFEGYMGLYHMVDHDPMLVDIAKIQARDLPPAVVAATPEETLVVAVVAVVVPSIVALAEGAEVAVLLFSPFHHLLLALVQPVNSVASTVHQLPGGVHSTRPTLPGPSS